MGDNEGYDFVVPTTGPLWPEGLALQGREDSADSCSCPDCIQCCPCLWPCYGLPIYFGTANLDDHKVSKESRIKYPCFYFPGCCPAWQIERANVNGVPMKFEAWECKGDCCGPMIKAYDWSDVPDGQEPKYIGKSEMKCNWCACCGDVEQARAMDADDNVVLRRFAMFCCCRAINHVVDRTCCTCWHSYRWGVKIFDESSYQAAVTERYHSCGICYPYQLSYTQSDMNSLANNLSRDQQKLLPLLLLSQWWRGAMVREDDADGDGDSS